MISEAKLVESDAKGKSPGYPESLVSKFQENAVSVDEQEKAQNEAYAELVQKIHSGFLSPQCVYEDINQALGQPDASRNNIESASAALDGAYENIEQFEQGGLINAEEHESIKSAVTVFFDSYSKACPEVPPVGLSELLNDNVRKLVYQTRKDKEVFAGSDHGSKHIIDGNLKFALELITGLEEHGINIGEKNKILIYQAIIDHDLGYNYLYPLARTEGRILADHPLLSAQSIEFNKQYYIDKFGEDGYEIIHKSVLYHTYPRSDYEFTAFAEGGPDYNLVRSITSTVDALGVTAETKVPSFFNEPEAVLILMKIRMLEESGALSENKEMLNKYKADLMAIADKESNPEIREGYRSAIQHFLSTFVVESVLGQYTGVIEGISVTEQDGKLVPKIAMRMSRVHAILGELFGSKMEMRAFVKAMKDFGLSSEKVEELGLVVEDERRHGDEHRRPLVFSTDRGIFEISSHFSEDKDDQFEPVRESLASACSVSIRAEINVVLNIFYKNPELLVSSAGEIRTDFFSRVQQKVASDEIPKLQELFDALVDDAKNRTETSASLLKQYLTANEKKFLGTA